MNIDLNFVFGYKEDYVKRIYFYRTWRQTLIVAKLTARYVRSTGMPKMNPFWFEFLLNVI